VIDTVMHGYKTITATFLILGDQTALIETGPHVSMRRVVDGVCREGVENLDWIVLTHIHLDHAGATGALAKRFPGARIAVHPSGARHLVDPTRLCSAVTEIYGEATEELWGRVEAVPASRIFPIDDHETIDLGGRALHAFATPGHAPHHCVYLDDLTGACFSGDAVGVKLPDVDAVRPSTPPPQFDLQQSIASIERIMRLEPESLWPTHFGPTSSGAFPRGVKEVCERAIEALEAWVGLITDGRENWDLREAVVDVKNRLEGGSERRLSWPDRDRLDQAAPVWLNILGYRQWMAQQRDSRVVAHRQES
jgi:glyoxylase-like metal-dependent hydrolase (beta-lactamase superfamily II)